MTNISMDNVRAVAEGVQVPFEIRLYSLAELLAMKTATTNEQSPLDAKRNEGLAQDLAAHMQLDPFKVIEADGELYLAGGRNRAHCQATLLGRPLDMQFACIVYMRETAAQINHAIVQLNNSRKTPKPEKLILSVAGATGKNVGKDDLSDNYKLALEEGALKVVKEWFIAETSAKLIDSVARLDLSGTTLIQLLTSVWTAVWTDKKCKAKMALIYRGPTNIYAFQELLLNVIPSALEATMKKHPHVRSWSRDGKQYLVDAVHKAVKEGILGDFSFPDGPVFAPATQSKAKSKKGALSITAPVSMPAIPEVAPVVEKVQTELFAG